MTWVLAVGQAAEVDPRLLELASARVRLSPCAPGPASALRLEREPLPPDAAGDFDAAWRPLDGVDIRAGAYRVDGAAIRIRGADSPTAAEAALKVLVQHAALRRGALLIHGAAVLFGERAVVAVGPSGAGKSTLARHCLAAGARLLSDETVAVDAANGQVFGSPFRSDLEAEPEVSQASLGGLVLLDKGAAEAIKAVLPAAAAPPLLSQVYRFDAHRPERAWLLRWAAALAERPGVHRLTFRNHPAVGPFLERWLHAPR